MRSTRNRRSVAALSFLAIAMSAALVLGGCATEGPIALDGLGERAMNARTENDHRELASAYEQQAGLDRDSSERHRKLALAYAKSWSPVVPWSHTTARAIGDSGLGRPIGNTALAGHCENLANLYAQASSANLELAVPHRQATVGATR